MKQLFHIERKQDTETSQQVLSVRVGEKHCCFAVTDRSGDELYQLAYYAADKPDENPLSSIVDQHPELKSDFYKVLVSYDYPQSTLVPVQHYKHEDAALLLKSIYGLNGNASVISEPISEWQVNNIYSVPKDLHEWISRKFDIGKYWHQHTLGAKNIKGADDAGHLLVDFRTEDFTVQAAAGGKLLLTQTFLYSTPEDVLYYLLKICQQFNLSQQLVQLSLSGLIDKQSALYKELYQYFIHIEFREAGWVNTDTEFPAHFFTSLNDLARCAS